MARKSNRANGQGTLEKRGKFYLARWTYQGKHFSKSTKCTDKKEAEKELAKIIAEFNTSKNLNVSSNHTQILIEDLFNVYRSDISLSPITNSSEDLYLGRFKKLEKFCSEKNIIYAYQFTTMYANEFLSLIKQSVKTRTYNQHGVFFRAVFNSVMKVDSNIKENPFKDFKMLQVDKSNTRRILSEDELAKLHTTIDTLDEEFKILFYMGEYEGMRESDIAICQWESIDFDNKIIKYLPIKTKKNGKYAIVPLHDKVYELLKQKFDALNCDEKYILPKLKKIYDKKNLHNYISKIFKKAGLSTFSYTEDGKLNIETGFHSLRHTFASKCGSNGIPIHHIQTMLGHTKPLMSLEYTHTNTKDLRLPEFNNETVSCRIKKSTYQHIESLRNKGESFDDCLERLLEKEITSLNNRSLNLMNIDDL
jgi:integrase